MNINWQLVVLLLGVIGMSLAAVCFTIWILKPEYEDEFGNPDEQPTEVWPQQP